jgi:predicted PurR-regulated permease PerM
MAMETERSRIQILLLYIVLAVLGYLVFGLFRPFLVPLAWAAVVVVFCYPMHARLERRLGPTWAASLSTVIVTLVLILPAIVVGTAFVREATSAVSGISAAASEGRLGAVQRAWEWLQQRLLGQTGADLTTLVKEGATRLATYLASELSTILSSVALFFFSLGFMLFAVFFLFRDAGSIMAWVRRALPFDQDHRERMLTSARDLVFATVTSGFLVAGIQGGLGGLAFWLLGLGAPVFWGVVMALFSLLPIGAWIIWLPAAAWLILNGSVAKGIILVAVGAGVVGTVDNILRPALLSGRAKLNGLLVFISLVGGVSLFGLLGLVLGPVILATTAGLLEVYTAEEATPSRPAAADPPHPES